MKQLLLTILGTFFPVLSEAQSLSGDGEAKSFYVKMVNASEVRLPEPWRAGLDLVLGEEKLAVDIRSGEKCSYRKMTFVGDERLTVRKTGSERSVVSLPAQFESGCFYTLLVHGLVTESGDDLAVIIRKDLPEDLSKKRKGFARVNVINAVSSFPVSVRIGESTQALKAGKSLGRFLPEGEQSLDLIFPDPKGEEQTRRHALILRSDHSYTVVVGNSTEGGRRPVLFKSCETMEVAEVRKLDRERSAKDKPSDRGDEP